MDFNEAQIRCIIATFKYMDESLDHAFRAAAGEANNRALCPQYVLDLLPEQQAALKPELASFRRKLRQFLKEQEIVVAPTTSATNAFKAAIGFIDISLEEIRPRRLNGYGSLSQGGATEISHLIGELKQITARMMAICDTTHSESH
jgi:hypothetical protein